jgi:UDP-glucose 4-epimerase
LSKKILITGGAGFIGSQLGHSLVQRGFEVTLLDNGSSAHLDNLIIGGKTFGHMVWKDIRDPDLAPYFEGVDAVLHIAGIAPLPLNQTQPRYAIDVNVAGTANVLEYSRLAGVRRVILASTSAIYENSTTPLHREDEIVAPDLIYSQTKVAAEALCRAYAVNHGLDVICARFFNVFGPHQDFKRKAPPFTSYVARELVLDRAPTLYNRTDARRDYIHVNDVIRLFNLMLASDRSFAGEAFNVCTGTGHSVPELYDLFLKVSGKSIQPVFKDPDGFWSAFPILFEGPKPMKKERIRREVFKHSVGDPSAAERVFGFRAEVTIEDGIRSVYEATRAALQA